MSEPIYLGSWSLEDGERVGATLSIDRSKLGKLVARARKSKSGVSTMMGGAFKCRIVLPRHQFTGTESVPSDPVSAGGEAKP